LDERKNISLQPVMQDVVNKRARGKTRAPWNLQCHFLLKSLRRRYLFRTRLSA